MVLLTNHLLQTLQKLVQKWFSTSYQGKAYYEFSPFNSNETLNVAWFVTPAINVDKAVKKRLTFQTAQHHVVNVENNFLEVFISTDFPLQAM